MVDDSTFGADEALRPTALIVDDESSVCELIADWLHMQCGVQPLMANSVAEAETVLSQRPITLLIVDLVLDTESGVDVIRLANSLQPNAIVILITAYPTVETAVTALQSGVYDYLVKPFKMDLLSATVRRALEKNRLRGENMHLREQVAITELMRAAGSSLQLDQILRMVIETVRREFSGAATSILLRSGWSDELELKAIDGAPTVLTSSPLKDFLHGRTPATQSALVTGTPVVLGGQQTELFSADECRHDLISQPLIAKGRCIGVLNIVRKATAGPCTDGTTRSIEMAAAQAAQSIENSRLYSDLYHSYMDTVSALANAIEFRDPYTRGHTDRVKMLAQSIAREMGWGVELMFDLWIGCTLHDIGKIGVPDSILNKPGPLTDGERRHMRRHTEIGVQMVQGVPFLRPAMPYIYYHHERFDGAGYPTGLGGREIPIEGRLLSVVDSFDAVTSDRPYRKGCTIGEAQAELQRCAGSQFDPEIVDVFLELIASGGISLAPEPSINTPALMKRDQIPSLHT
ncbi:MAG: HD domain-containing protein [candidate division Zixibacteria bacterium]|nr:HD domain-containing protein [candidate division Zixibacteria bacterium]